MAEEPKVYLDHLILRESLRYKRAEQKHDYDIQNQPTSLRMSDLVGDHMSSRVQALRKPDFQRATWAWSPEDCVLLLESVVTCNVESASSHRILLKKSIPDYTLPPIILGY